MTQTLCKKLHSGAIQVCALTAVQCAQIQVCYPLGWNLINCNSAQDAIHTICFVLERAISFTFSHCSFCRPRLKGCSNMTMHCKDDDDGDDDDAANDGDTDN